MTTTRPSDASRKRVAVIDDEPDIGDIIKRALKRQYDVDLFESATDVYSALDAGERYDVIFCDLFMPAISGREVYEELAQRWPEQAEKIIFMSGVSARGAKVDILEGLDNDIMEKPFRLSMLREKVGEMSRR